MKIVVVLCLFFGSLSLVASKNEESDDREDPHRDPSRCEVCKTMAIELQGSLDDTGKSREVFELGYNMDQREKQKKKITYKTSELRFIEATENVCERILEYNLHAERQGSRRFAKGMSETMSTLHGLVDKGVKVELGIPLEMWDDPSAEISNMKKLCEQMMEQYEEDISDWYFKLMSQVVSLQEYLCKDKILDTDEQECLEEFWTGKEKVYKDKEDDESDDKEKENEDSSKKSKKKDKKAKNKNGKGDSGNSDKDEL